MSNWKLQLFGAMVDGAVQSAAMRSMANGPPQGRKAKKKGGCTPCAAMANVDKHRSRLGYSIT